MSRHFFVLILIAFSHIAIAGGSDDKPPSHGFRNIGEYLFTDIDVDFLYIMSVNHKLITSDGEIVSFSVRKDSIEYLNILCTDVDKFSVVLGTKSGKEFSFPGNKDDSVTLFTAIRNGVYKPVN